MSFKVVDLVVIVSLVVLCGALFVEVVSDRGRLTQLSDQNFSYRDEAYRLHEKIGGLKRDLEARDLELAKKAGQQEAISKELTTYRSELSREMAGHTKTRLELTAAKMQTKVLEARMNDAVKKGSGQYQREAQDLINRFVWNAVDWENLWQEEQSVFGVDFSDNLPTNYSARYAMVYYDSSMRWLEKDAEETGHYFGYGNLGDVLLGRLGHVVVSARRGIIPRSEAQWRLERMERYVRPGDTNSIKLLSALRTSLTTQ